VIGKVGMRIVSEFQPPFVEPSIRPLQIGANISSYAAAFHFKLNIFDPDALSDTLHLYGRDISRRDRKDRIASGGDISEKEPAVFIGPGARRIGRPSDLGQLDDHHAARRLAFQRDQSGDRGRPGFFYLAWLSLN
jgi:hypothetical protein